MDLVSEGRQSGPCFLGDPALDVQPARIVAVRLEGVREAVTGKARCLDCRLRVHAEEDDVQERLEHCLWLDVSPRGAEHHEGASVPQG